MRVWLSKTTSEVKKKKDLIKVKYIEKKQIKNEWQKYCHSPWNSLCPRNPANEITRNRTDICHYKPVVILWVMFLFKGSFYNDRRLTTNVCNFKSSEDNTRAHQCTTEDKNPTHPKCTCLLAVQMLLHKIDVVGF